MSKIIGIVGRRRAGKDLVASHLLQKGYENKKFVGPMKNALKALFDLSHEQVEGDLKEVVDERWRVTPRQLMQFFGTEMMQYKLPELMPWLGRNFAVHRMFLDDESAQSNFCVSDVRFQHEVDAIHQHGGITIHLHRETPLTDVDQHQSEAGIDTLQCTHDIDNNGTIEQLFAAIEKIINV